MREAYREIFLSCHMKYGLGVPFIERFFELAEAGRGDTVAGFVGLIVANSFMKREFGTKLVEEVLPGLDLTHVVDCAGAYIPGHGTPTAIMFGRNRLPLSGVVRTVRGIRGEPGAPDDPAKGLVWSAILAQTDIAGSASDFIDTEDTPRSALTSHPWNLGGGGAAAVQATIEADRPLLERTAAAIGVFGMTNADEVMLADDRAFTRSRCEPSVIRQLIVGDAVRDWRITSVDHVIFPYEGRTLIELGRIPFIARWLWPARTTMGNRATFSQRTYFSEGRPWWAWHQVAIERLGGCTITCPYVGTHNHFVLDREDRVFKQTSPIIKLPAGTSEADHIGLLGLLNSSTACFWLKQVGQNRGSTTDDRGARQRTLPFEDFYEFTAGILQKFPLAANPPRDLAQALDKEAQRLAANLPRAVSSREMPTRAALDTARAAADAARDAMVALQEELDWRCYHLYGLVEVKLEHSAPPPIMLGERAFEIVMARRLEVDTQESVWFSRHGSTPITDLPSHWPPDYRAVVERRIELIESNPSIGLIERPEYKRRWSAETWEELEQAALRAWLLDRLEGPHYWPTTDARLASCRALADAARLDTDFLSVAALYVGRNGFDLDALLAELTVKESVPFLPALRYSEAGLRKRADWEVTWAKQREEDAIDADLVTDRERFLRTAWTRANLRRDDETADVYAARMAAGLGDAAIGYAADLVVAAEGKRLKEHQVGPIPVPPKFRASDFISAGFWRLRGGLDVPKERFISFPFCARDAEDSVPVLWAGYDQLARAKAIAAWYVDRKDTDGWPAPRLIPLLAGLLELVPWLLQWHNGLDPETGLHMGDYFAEFVEDEARSLQLAVAELRAWAPPAPVRRTRSRRTAA